MWDKETTNLVRVLKGDDSIVNCLQPHPSMCLLATSGIDPVIRLWSPRPQGEDTQDWLIDEVEAAAKANQRRMNADPLEVMLMNMGYRTRFTMAEGSDAEDEAETPIQCRTSQENKFSYLLLEFNVIWVTIDGLLSRVKIFGFVNERLQYALSLWIFKLQTTGYCKLQNIASER